MVNPFTHGWGRLAGMLTLVVLAAGCRQDMHDQPKYRGLRGSDFFADGQSARPLIANTVARGHLNEDALLMTGRVGEEPSTVFPFPVTEQVLDRGRERFDIYCSPCHGRTGLGDGMVVRRGFRRPPSLMDERLRNAAAGHFFDVITNGFGAMPDYQAQILVNDRWAIAAYVRALQLAGYAPVDVVPAADRSKLDQPRTTGAEARAPETERR